MDLQHNIHTDHKNSKNRMKRMFLNTSNNKKLRQSPSKKSYYFSDLQTSSKSKFMKKYENSK